MAIYAESNGSGNYTPMEAGVYVARCTQLIQIGSVTEEINGESKTLHKVRFGFEFPEEKKVFKEENGEQPGVHFVDAREGYFEGTFKSMEGQGVYR